MRYYLVETELGWIGVAASPAGLRAVTLPVADAGTALAALPTPGALEPAAAPELGDLPERLRRYAAGREVSFQDVRLDPDVGTPFQREVWATIRRIPWGETRSYDWIAGRIGRPWAVRAVGQAVGRNPWPLVVPCHRVVAAGGGLGGFGGGLALKRRLLALEGRRALVL